MAAVTVAPAPVHDLGHTLFPGLIPDPPRLLFLRLALENPGEKDCFCCFWIWRVQKVISIGRGSFFLHKICLLLSVPLSHIADHLDNLKQELLLFNFNY